MSTAGEAAAARDPQSGAYRYVVLALLALSYVLNFADRQIMGILAPQMKASLGLSDAQLGLLGGFAFAVSYSALGVPLGLLADRYGRSRIVAASLAVWSAFTMLTGTTSKFWVLFLCRVGVGTGEAGGVAPAHALIAGYFPPRQWAGAFAVYSLGIPIGSAAGLFVGAQLAAYLQWRGAFIVCGAVGVFLAPLLFLCIREPPRVVGKSERTSVSQSEHPAFLRPAFWLVSLGAASSSMTSYAMAFWMPSFLVRSHHLSTVGASKLLGGAVLFAGSAGVLLGGKLADWLAPRDERFLFLLPALLYFLAAPAYAATVLVAPLWATAALYVIPIFLTYAPFGPTLAALQLNSPPEHRASTSALFLFILNLIGIGAGILVVGLMSDTLHARFGADSLRYSILLDLAFLLLGSALFVAAAFSVRRRQPVPSENLI